MPVVEINDLASVGQINDLPPYMLAPEAWTLAENIRFAHGSPQVMDGWAQVFGTLGTGVGDPFFSSTVLLLGFEGADGSTGAPGMTDNSPAAKGTGTVTGAAQIDTAQAKFGTSSLLLDGNSKVSFPDSTDWQFPGQFTVECSLRVPAFATSTCAIVGTGTSATFYGWYLAYTNAGTVNWRMDDNGDGTATHAINSGTTTFAVNTWTTIAVDRDATNTLRLYMNGVMVASVTSSETTWDAPSTLDVGYIGSTNSLATSGWVDELRITKGVARYASDAGYTVPTAAFPRTAGGGGDASPHFALPVKSSVQTFWLYTSLTRAYVYDGNIHSDITRATGGNYTANLTSDWNGVVFGGIPILNNGHDVPQYWPSYNILTHLAPLPNWPTTMTAMVVRNFGSYLVAFNVTDSLTTAADGSHVFPHLVQWSNPADPGHVPTSWSYSDPTTEGGRKDLPDVNSGIILEALQLQNTMMIYKERSIWKMTFIGGAFIFQFDTFLSDVGILAPRCVCGDGTGTRHVVATNDDIIVHNGNTPQSILTDKTRLALFNTINRDQLNACFMFLNKPKDEVWFCYPELGQLQATRALVWNYKNNVCSTVSGITFRNAILGDIQGSSDEKWSDGTDSWDVDTGPWSQMFKQKILLCGTDATKFYQLDSGTTRDGVSFRVTLQREDLGIIGRTSGGKPVNDFKQQKLVDSIWPKVDGAPIQLRVGFRDFVGPNAPLTWQDYTVFNPLTDLWVNAIVNESLPGSGKAVSVEFSSLTSVPWRLDGYSMNVEVIGPY